MRIEGKRFAKTGAERYTQLAQTPQSPKIFLLPGFATRGRQKLVDVVNARGARFWIAIDGVIARFKKTLSCSHNLSFPQRDRDVDDDADDDDRVHSQRDLSNADRSLSGSNLKASLSTSVSFSFCWCIGMRCRSIRGPHISIEAISLTGGQHGEEGEESEEDGEEGSEEEEVQEEVRSRRRQ